VYARGAKAVGAKEELTVDSKYLRLPANREVFFLERVERFDCELMVKGCSDIRLGSASEAAIGLVRVGLQRQFSEAEDLAAVTLFGSTREVMDRDLEVGPRRAANFGTKMYVFNALMEHPNNAQLQGYDEGELNTVRTYGLEQQCFYIGKRVLVVVKLPEDPEEGGGHESSLQCDDGSYVSGNKPATVVDWKVR
jgi:hypothetical protein